MNKKIEIKKNKVSNVKTRIVKKIEEVSSISLTRDEALEFLRLVEEQQNSEAVERARKLRIIGLMKKAKAASFRAMEHVVRRVI